MRPAILNPLFAGATGLKGIGQKLDRTLAQFLRPPRNGEASEARILDLLFHLPAGLIDRRFRPRIAGLPQKGIVTVEVTVGRHRPPPPNNKRVPYRVEVFDETGTLTLVFFHAFADHLKKALPEGERRFVSGEIDWYNGTPQIAHPDHMVSAAEFEALPLIEPVYPLTAGLSGKILARAIAGALARLPELPEWQDEAFRQRHGWPAFGEALRALHHPVTPAALGPEAPSRRRLAYDELLANQLALSLVRGHLKREAGRSFVGDGAKRKAIAAALPYRLTQAQEAALAEICDLPPA